MAERYVLCTKSRPGLKDTVGTGKHVWWTLEQARAAAQTKLSTRSALNARVFVGAVDADATGIAPGLGGSDPEERWRVLVPTPVRYVETVRHTEDRLIKLTEERMTQPQFAPLPPGTRVEITVTPPTTPGVYIDAEWYEV